MRKLIAMGVVALGVAGCKSEETLITVYEAGPVVQQCEAPVTTLQQSALRLDAAGVRVVQSSCGTTGLNYAAVCGAPSGQVLLHDIRTEDVPDAEAAGFALADSMADDPERGWQRIECAK